MVLRKRYIQGKLELQYYKHELLEIMRPIYGLDNAGNNWNARFLLHLEGDLGITKTSKDFSSDIKGVQNVLREMITKQIHNTLSARDLSSGLGRFQ